VVLNDRFRQLRARSLSVTARRRRSACCVVGLPDRPGRRGAPWEIRRVLAALTNPRTIRQRQVDKVWWPVPCSLRHTRPNLPGRGTSPLAVPGRPQLAGRRLSACSLPGSTGGSEGVPLADETVSPSSTTLRAYRHRAQEAGGERCGVDRDTRLERLRTHLCVMNSPPSLRGGLVGGWVDITGLGGAGSPTRMRVEACESTATNSEGLSRAVSHEDVVELQRLVAGAAQVGELRQQAWW